MWCSFHLKLSLPFDFQWCNTLPYWIWCLCCEGCLSHLELIVEGILTGIHLKPLNLFPLCLCCARLWFANVIVCPSVRPQCILRVVWDNRLYIPCECCLSVVTPASSVLDAWCALNTVSSSWPTPPRTATPRVKRQSCGDERREPRHKHTAALSKCRDCRESLRRTPHDVRSSEMQMRPSEGNHFMPVLPQPDHSCSLSFPRSRSSVPNEALCSSQALFRSHLTSRMTKECRTPWVTHQHYSSSWSTSKVLSSFDFVPFVFYFTFCKYNVILQCCPFVGPWVHTFL